MSTIGAFAGGAADALKELLIRKHLEFQQQEELRQRQQQIDQAAARDAVAAQLGRGRLALDEGELGLNRAKFDEGKRQFDAEAPSRSADVAYKGALTSDVLRKPQAEQQDRDFTTNRDKTLHGYRLIQTDREGAQQRATLRMRTSQTPTAPAQASPYAAERTTRVRESVAALKNKVGGWTAGPGSVLSAIPGTDAKNFQAELQTLKANIAFGELTEMRAASKTGGALGQVSDKEMQLLESSLGALDQAQSPANLKAQLEKIEQSLARWEAAKAGRPDVSGAPDVKNMNDPKARAAELLKKYGG